MCLSTRDFEQEPVRVMKRYLPLASIFLFLFGGVLYAQTERIGRAEVQELRWGGIEKGWKNIFKMKDVEERRGELSRLDVVLADYSPVPDQNTDLLLTFDRSTMHTMYDIFPNYTLGEVDIFPSQNGGKSSRRAAGFLRYSNTIEVMPLEGSVFLSDAPVKSFMIDFHLHPTSIISGGSVVEWYAPTVETGGNPTGFKAFLQNGRLYWLFENVFYARDGKAARGRNAAHIDNAVRGDKAVRILAGELEKTLVNEWHHHALQYDADSGLLTLLFDGRESSLTWLTETGQEGGTLLQGRFSRYLAVWLTIGKQFLGFIDNFRITRGAAELYNGSFINEGQLISDVLDLGYRGTKLIKLSWDSTEENGTAMRFFCRVSDDYFLPSAQSGEEESSVVQRAGIPQWIPVKNNQEFPAGGLRGRYMQWKARLYGTRGLYSPSLHLLTVFVEPDLPPSPPVLIEAVPLNGAVWLRWAKNRESDVQGYMVYYGDASKTYFGRGSDIGDAPVFVGNTDTVTLTGLKNEQAYFISITAVDDADQESGFSREFIVRPSEIYGDN